MRFFFPVLLEAIIEIAASVHTRAEAIIEIAASVDTRAVDKTI